MEVSGVNTELGRDQFLQLLVAQLRAQDPLDPITSQEFIAQLAQFSTVEGIERLNASFADLLALNQITQGANLIGRTASYEVDGSATLVQGTVEGFSLENGRLQLLIDGTTVPLTNIRSVT